MLIQSAEGVWEGEHSFFFVRARVYNEYFKRAPSILKLKLTNFNETDAGDRRDGAGGATTQTGLYIIFDE